MKSNSIRMEEMANTTEPLWSVKDYHFTSRGLSGYWACRQVADSQGPVLVAGLFLK
jgi:hypothetical protein